MKLLPFLLSILQNFWVFFHQFQSFLFLVIISVQWWFQSIKLNTFTISRHHFTEIYGFFPSFSKFYSFSSSFLYNDGFKALSWTLLLFLVIISQKFMVFFHHFQSFTLSRHHFCTMMVSKHKKTWCISIVIIVKWCYFIVIIVKRCF